MLWKIAELDLCGVQKMHFSAKCNSGRIAIQWFYIKHYLDYQYSKFQPYTFRVQKMRVFERYVTLVPWLSIVTKLLSSAVQFLCKSLLEPAKFNAFI